MLEIWKSSESLKKESTIELRYDVAKYHTIITL